MDEDLKDLIANPRENETIELKAWLDLDERSHQAKVARHLAALANHGGGYLVFGFNDDLTPDKENRPQSLDKYTRDRFTGIIERYLTPVFQCAVSHIADSSGNQFPSLGCLVMGASQSLRRPTDLKLAGHHRVYALVDTTYASQAPRANR